MIDCFQFLCFHLLPQLDINAKVKWTSITNVTILIILKFKNDKLRKFFRRKIKLTRRSKV